MQYLVISVGISREHPQPYPDHSTAQHVSKCESAANLMPQGLPPLLVQ